MLKEILSYITDALKEAGARHVYTAFESVPYDRRPKEPYIVVSADTIETSRPVYTEYEIYLPFTAAAAVSVIAPEGMPLREIYDVFDTQVLPATERSGSISCRLKGVTLKYDSNIKRTVLKASISVTGICRLERKSV